LTGAGGAAEDSRLMTEHPIADTIYESVAQVRSPLILEMLAYWRSKTADGRLPRPVDIDPTEIPKLIASMVICFGISVGSMPTGRGRRPSAVLLRQ